MGGPGKQIIVALEISSRHDGTKRGVGNNRNPELFTCLGDAVVQSFRGLETGFGFNYADLGYSSHVLYGFGPHFTK